MTILESLNFLQKLWVKYGNSNCTQVSCDGCLNVDDFLGASKKNLLFLYGQFPPGELSLSLTIGGEALKPDEDIPPQNTAKTPLFIKVAQVSSYHLPTLWKATGSIPGARKIGFRRGIFRTAQNYLGFYEKIDTQRQDPFLYDNEGSLI